MQIPSYQVSEIVSSVLNILWFNPNYQYDFIDINLLITSVEYPLLLINPNYTFPNCTEGLHRHLLVPWDNSQIKSINFTNICPLTEYQFTLNVSKKGFNSISETDSYFSSK